jgi:hypothetical protein
MKVQLFLLSVADLGFPEGALTREILGSDRDQDLFGNPSPFTGGKGRELGLELCPPDVGPTCRLEYKDQPLNESLYVAMKPIKTPDGEPRIFVIAHAAKGLSLDAARARPDDNWSARDKFIFCVCPEPLVIEVRGSEAIK